MERKEIETTKCIYGKLFDIEEALKHVKYNNEDVKNSIIRLKSYINTLCLVCNKELRVEEDQNKYKDIDKKIKYKKIKLKKNMINEGENNFDEIDHLICEECYMKNFKGNKMISDENEEEENEENDRNDKVVDLDKGTIFCEICDKNHNLDPKVVDEGGCCTDCSIF